MKLKKIKIKNIHNFQTAQHDLSDLTYLHGDNGVGKSTVLQSIQWALLGYIPGTAKQTSAIFKHASEGSNQMSVQLFIDDNGTEVKVSRSIKKDPITKKLTASTSVDPKGYDIQSVLKSVELPIFNFDEFVNMTANKLKEWFTDFLPNEDISINWSDLFLESLEDASIDDIDKSIVEDVLGLIKKDVLASSTDNEVKCVNEFLKSELSARKRERDRLQSTVQSLIFYDDVVDGATSEEIRSEIRELSHRRSRLVDYQIATERLKSYETQLKQYEDLTEDSVEDDSTYQEHLKAMEDISDKLSVNEAEVTRIEGEMSSKQDKIKEIRAKDDIKIELIEGRGVCPITSTMCQEASRILDLYKDDVEENRHVIVALNEEVTKLLDERNKLRANESILREDASYHRSCVEKLKQNYRERDRLIKVIESSKIADIEESESTEYFDIQISTLNDLLVKIVANENYNKMIDEITTEKLALDTTISYIKIWIKATGVNGVQNSDETSGPFAKLISKMNPFLESFFEGAVTCSFNLEEQANSFSFGIKRDDNYIPFIQLSSGEQCMYALSLMLSLVDIADSKLKLILVDDLLDHLDDINFQKVFDYIKNIKNTQMIFAGVKPIDDVFVVELK